MVEPDTPLARHTLVRALGFEPDAAQRERVADEQLRMVLAHTRAGTVAATVFALLMAMHLQGTVAAGIVHTWVLIKIATAVLRIVLAQVYTRVPEMATPDAWRRLTYTFLALDGAVWGVAGAWLMSEAETTASLVAAALACVTCVATFGLQVRLVATAAYVTPILVPTALALMLRGDDFGWVGGVGLLLLLGLQVVTARTAQQRLVAGLLLRMQAQRLADEREAALRLAQRQSEVKTQFMAKISHELRTPLHGILGLARLLHLEARDADVSRRVELIETSGTHLLGLINDLLDVSRIEAGQFAVRSERFELITQFEQVAEVFAVRAAEKGLGFATQVHLPRPYWVAGDAARFRQVLHNLLGNAIKFTRRGGIGFSVATGASDDMVRVEVRDTGRGIAEAELANIFKPFQQSELVGAHPQDGAGLGLTIAREIAQAMGGDIMVSSRTGVGSTFIFTARMPASPMPHTASLPAVAAGGQAPLEVAAATSRRVLVAEDDEVNAMIVMAYLEALGLAAERVVNGKEAVGRALRESERPDLVLMDCRMPVMDGLQATREIRAQEVTLGLPRVPIIALTATTADTDRADCLSAGMDDFVPKPFSRQDLSRAINQWGRLPAG